METENNETTETIAKGGNRQMGPVAENNTGESDTNMMPPMMNGEAPSDLGEMPEGEMPELPEDFDESEMGQGMMRGFGGGREMMMGQETRENTWHPAAYLAMGGVSVLLGIVISYACFSKCFHLKPGQAFSSGAKFMACAGVAVIIAVLLCVLCYFIPIWIA